MAESPQIPIIDISPLLSGDELDAVAAQIRQACCHTGCFYVVGYGIDEAL